MATLDLVTDAGSKPATCFKCRTRAQLKYITACLLRSPSPGLEFLYQSKNIKVVLVNIVGSVPTALEIASVITNFVHATKIIPLLLKHAHTLILA
jgi:succinyl-CoA synthetase beta subunit